MSESKGYIPQGKEETMSIFKTYDSKLRAIKCLLELNRPHLSLSDCKMIVENWIAELAPSLKEENEQLKEKIIVLTDGYKDSAQKFAEVALMYHAQQQKLDQLKTIFELAPDMYARELGIINS